MCDGDIDDIEINSVFQENSSRQLFRANHKQTPVFCAPIEAVKPAVQFDCLRSSIASPDPNKNQSGSFQSSASGVGIMSSVEEIEVTCFAELLLSSTEGRTASLESVESGPHTNTEMSITYPVQFVADH